MSGKLFIAEKPSVAAALSAEMGNPVKKNGYFEVGGNYVLWLYGHILQQAMPDDYNPAYRQWKLSELPIVPDKWKMKPPANDPGKNA